MTQIPPVAHIVNAFSFAHSPGAFAAAFARIKPGIPGWSHPFHLAFFSRVLDALQPPANVLVCGVYHGLDLALINDAAIGRECILTGVDLFEDAPCADWTPEQKARGTWGAIGVGQPPSIEAAKRNAPRATIEKSDSAEWMRAHPQAYDFIYLDTSHDEETVTREIAAARIALKPGGLLAGDDYYEPGTNWGVDRAVQRALPNHVVFYSRIWLAQP